MFADSHAHSLMKYVQNARNDVWQPFEGRWARFRIKDDLVGIPEYSQSDFATMAAGGVQVVMVALIPPEQKFMFTKFPPGISDEVDKIAAAVTCIPINQVRMYQEPTYNHYEYLLRERDLLYSHHNQVKTIRLDGGRTQVCLKLVNTSAELDQVLQHNAADQAPYTIAVVPTVEGIHGLGRGHLYFFGAPNSGNVSDELLLERVDKLKGVGNDTPFASVWKFPPLLMNITHAFDNGICGQPQAFSKIMRSVFLYDEPYRSVDQGPNFTRGLNQPLSPLGERIIKRMLNLDAESQARTNPGRKIIPDIKHMSVQTRTAYYRIIDAANHGIPAGKRIPVVMSHAAVNGFPQLPDGPSSDENPFPDDTDEAYKESTGFNPWSINLYDDEIIRVHETYGLIGIIMDERVLAGGKRVKLLRAHIEGRAGLRNPFRKYKRAEACAMLIADQIAHIVSIIQNSTTTVAPAMAWDRIAIGSDFDGQINPLDSFTASSDFPLLRKSLTKLLSENRFTPLLQGLTVDQVLDKICFQNVIEFLRRNL